MATSRERQCVLKDCFRPGCNASRICAADGATRWCPRVLRFPDLPRIFRTLRRFDLQADRGGQITVKTATGGTATFPEADCTCPIVLGPSIANLAGGNMQGSCEPPRPDTIWSTYQPRPNIPQALTDWVPAPAPPLFCPKRLGLGNQLVNCFSFLCDSQTYINNAPVVTCHCPIGESLAGTAVPPHTAFLTQAGQGDEATCAMYPVSGPISLP